jgi:hypothetical protein
MNIFKKFFAVEEDLKFQLALGKYVWKNKEEKIEKLKSEVEDLQKRNEVLLGQLKTERMFNAKILAERKTNGKGNVESTGILKSNEPVKRTQI